MIPSSTIDEIRSKSDILQIVGEYVPLKKRGKNYLGLCPFHSEKTPSFTVSPDKQIFHCFGCGEGGNIFSFLMKMENISFSEAVELLGGKVGITVQKSSAPSVNKNDKEKLIEIMELAERFYRETLDGIDGAAARDYLKKRGISDESAKTFKLGCSPSKWDSLLNYLYKRGVDRKDMEKLGLIIERTDKSGHYDRFRGRLMFPIHDLKGRVIGFGGRVIPSGAPSEEEAKYINSPDSPIYNKGYSLYGIDVTKDDIKRSRTAVLVEGNVDLISCWQYGIKNAVCPLGTGFTQNQAKILRRFSDSVIIAFDRDNAGNAATARSVDILKDEGLNVKVSGYEGGKDPDEALKAKGAEAFLKSLTEAVPWMEFMIMNAISKHNIKEIEGRAKAAKEAAQIIAREKDELVRGEYIKLAAKNLGFGAEEIASEVQKVGFYSEKGGSTSLRRTVEKPSSKTEIAEECLIKLSVNSKEIMDLFKKSMTWQEFTGKDARTIAELLLTAEIDSGDPSHFLLENLPDEDSKKLFSRIMVSDLPDENVGKVAQDCINTIKVFHVRSKMENLRKDIMAAEKEGKLQDVSALHREFTNLNENYRSLSA